MLDQDGGPAFPVPNYVNAEGSTHESKPCGMSLRDYFAGQFALGFVASPELLKVITADAIRGVTAKERCAVTAYVWADAMLKAREA
jgi:hypothetical protein